MHFNKTIGQLITINSYEICKSKQNIEPFVSHKHYCTKKIRSIIYNDKGNNLDNCFISEELYDIRNNDIWSDYVFPTSYELVICMLFQWKL